MKDLTPYTSYNAGGDRQVSGIYSRAVTSTKEAHQILALLSNVNHKMANTRLTMCTIYADGSIKRT